MCYGNILQESLSKARKPHRCADCEQLIALSEKHYVQVYADSDGIHRVHEHTRCRAMAEAVNNTADDWCVSGDPRESLRYGAWREIRAMVSKSLDALKRRVTPSVVPSAREGEAG